MTVGRTFKIVAATMAGVGALAALGLLWSANYAAAVYVVSHQSNIWTGFTSGNLLLPFLQAWAWWGLPVVSKIVTLANAGLAVETAIVGGAGYLLVATPWKVPMPKDGARVATLVDLQKAGLLDGRPGYSMLLGTFKGRDVRYSGDSHFYVNGPSRSGKGRGFVMPNLLEWKGSAVVLDVKQENYDFTGAARMALGQKVYLIAPGSAASHRWNPLDVVRPWPERATDLMNLAASLIVVPDKGEEFWGQTSRSLVAGLLGYVTDSETMLGRSNLRSVLRMLSAEESLSKLLDHIVENEPKLHPFILDAFNQHRGRDPKQRPSFEAHVTTALKGWNNSLVADVTSASDFDIRELRRTPFTIYIAAPVSDFGLVEPVIRLLIQQIHDVMLRNRPGSDEPHKVVLILDEFYQFQRLPEIINRAPLVAGFGFRIALVAQNIPQIDERYSKATREALLGNMDIKLVVAVGDKATGDVVSEAIGKHYVEREGWGESGGGPFGGRTRQGRWEAAPLMTADQLQRFDDSKTVLNIRGHFSAVLDKLNFYTDKRFVKRVAEVAGYSSFLTVPRVESVEEWELFKRPAPSVEANLRELGRLGPAFGGSSAKAQVVKIERAGEWTRIERLAHLVFDDAWSVLQKVELAMSASDSGEIGRIIHELRTKPHELGSLRGSEKGVDLRARAARKAALGSVKALREAIIAERRSVNAHHARLYRETLAEPGSRLAGEGDEVLKSAAAKSAEPQPPDGGGSTGRSQEVDGEGVGAHASVVGSEVEEAGLPTEDDGEDSSQEIKGENVSAPGSMGGIGDEDVESDGEVTSWAMLRREVNVAMDSVESGLADAQKVVVGASGANMISVVSAKFAATRRLYQVAVSDENRLTLPKRA